MVGSFARGFGWVCWWSLVCGLVLVVWVWWFTCVFDCCRVCCLVGALWLDWCDYWFVVFGVVGFGVFGLLIVLVSWFFICR